MPAKTKRNSALIAGVLGLLALAAGGLLVVTRIRNPSPVDASVALTNLAVVRLNRLTATDSIAISVIIPDTPQWTRIRRRWGEPDFLVAAVSPGKSSCYCLPKLPLTITVTHNGEQVPRRPAGPPYAYSSDCSISTFQFNAAPGTKLAVSVARNGTGPLPPGDLIIVGSWRNTKDRLVGISLDQWFRNVSTIAIVFGSVLILAAWLTWRWSG